MLFEVTAKCGHVGKNMYTLKTFAVIAPSRSEAATLVRNLPRVKHHQRDAILRVVNIDPNRYHEIQRLNQYDPYFHCHSIQEQRRLCHNLMIYEEMQESIQQKAFSISEGKPIYDRKQRIRNVKKYVRLNQFFEEDGIA